MEGPMTQRDGPAPPRAFHSGKESLEYPLQCSRRRLKSRRTRMRRLWFAFATVVAVSFAALGWVGREIYRHKPPIPREVVDASGRAVFEPGDVEAGQNVW